MSNLSFCGGVHQSLKTILVFICMFVSSLTHISLASFLWDIGKQCRPRSDATKECRICQ